MNDVSTPWILLRGLSREAAHWGSFGDTLARATGQPVLALDLPGAGTRHRDRCPASIDDMATACRQALCDLGQAGPVQLLGLSMGGLVAHAWARQMASQPGPAVRRLVMVNSSMAGLLPPWRRLRPSAWPRLAGVALAWHHDSTESAILQLTSARAAQLMPVLDVWRSVRRVRPVTAANATRQLLAASRYRAHADAPQVPTLLVASRGDALVHVDCSQALAQRWQAELALHPWAGHDLPLDDGAWLALAIARWVARTDGADGLAGP